MFGRKIIMLIHGMAKFDLCMLQITGTCSELFFLGVLTELLCWCGSVYKIYLYSHRWIAFSETEVIAKERWEGGLATADFQSVLDNGEWDKLEGAFIITYCNYYLLKTFTETNLCFLLLISKRSRASLKFKFEIQVWLWFVTGRLSALLTPICWCFLQSCFQLMP